MMETTQLSESVYLDEETQTVIVRIDEIITMNLHIQEFWDMTEGMVEARAAIKSHPGFVVTEKSNFSKTQVIAIHEDDEVH